MNKELQVRERVISPNNLFVIAEVGNQFGGSKDTALKLVDVAAESGADAVKFIWWFPDEILADRKQLYTYKTSEGDKTETMYDLLNRIRLQIYDWAEVAFHCIDKDIIFMSTVLSPTGIDYADELGLEIFKLSSWDWNYTDLWEQVAGRHRIVIADTGPVYEQEIDRNVDIMKKWGNDQLVLMHCFHTQKYPEMNMMAIPYMADKYDCLVGYSSADYNDITDIIAVSLGACVLEKRLTLDRKGGVLHDAVSKEPDEFRNYVRMMRNVKASLGKRDIIPSPNDLEERKKWFRRIVADIGIQKGETIVRSYLEAKRGETGISPEYMDKFLGRTATRDIGRNEDILWSDVT